LCVGVSRRGVLLGISARPRRARRLGRVIVRPAAARPTVARANAGVFACSSVNNLHDKLFSCPAVKPHQNLSLLLTNTTTIPTTTTTTANHTPRVTTLYGEAKEFKLGCASITPSPRSPLIARQPGARPISRIAAH
jgi:hypothetical protein